MPHRLIPLDTAPGIAESQLHPSTGLRIGHYETQLTSVAAAVTSARAIGGAGGAAVTAYTQIAITGLGRMFPSTICCQVVQAAPAIATVRFRLTGYDQYGMAMVEETPVVALPAIATNFVYLAKTFSSVQRIEFQSTVLDIAADLINVGTRYDWTRTDTGAANHLHGDNLGVALFRWSGSYAQGAANPARHKLQNYEMFAGFEVPQLQIYNITDGYQVGLGPEGPIPTIGRADAADWEASPDKWAIAAADVAVYAWDVTDTVKVSLFQNSRSTGFHR